MKHLTVEQFHLCQQYNEMVSCIEEGFGYVRASFTDFTKTEGDLVLLDIFQAMTKITQTNTLLERLLADDDEIQQALKQYKDVTDAAFKLDGHFDQYNTRVKVVNENLYPTFSAWRESIQIALARYVDQ